MWRADSFEKTLMLGKIEGRGEGDDRGCDGWMVSPTQWTWVWVSCGSWWWTGRPGLLWFMGLQRVRHEWATELNWTEDLNRAGKYFIWKFSKVNVLQKGNQGPLHKKNPTEDLVKRGGSLISSCLCPFSIAFLQRIVNRQWQCSKQWRYICSRVILFWYL